MVAREKYSVYFLASRIIFIVFGLNVFFVLWIGIVRVVIFIWRWARLLVIWRMIVVGIIGLLFCILTIIVSSLNAYFSIIFVRRFVFDWWSARVIYILSLAVLTARVIFLWSVVTMMRSVFDLRARLRIWIIMGLSLILINGLSGRRVDA